jgi:hypothetical protein
MEALHFISLTFPIFFIKKKKKKKKKRMLIKALSPNLLSSFNNAPYIKKKNVN